MLNVAPSPETHVVRHAGASTTFVGADLCVVGAGISGVSAAIEAARLGRDVLLVDGLPALGGQAVNSIIGTFCGLFANGTQGAQLTHGIADDILRDLGAQGALHYRQARTTTVVLYDEVALGRWVEKPSPPASSMPAATRPWPGSPACLPRAGNRPLRLPDACRRGC